MKRVIFDEAVSIARQKIKTHPEYKNYIHYSFVVFEGKIVGWGRNHSAEPPKHYGYHARLQYPIAKTHAEIDAYRRCRYIIKDEVFEIINIRMDRTGKLRISKPCCCCYELLTELGCKKFYYSSEVGFLTQV